MSKLRTALICVSLLVVIVIAFGIGEVTQPTTHTITVTVTTTTTPTYSTPSNACERFSLYNQAVKLEFLNVGSTTSERFVSNYQTFVQVAMNETVLYTPTYIDSRSSNNVDTGFLFTSSDAYIVYIFDCTS
jgi:ABC-type glycerol-3-phosphate transport system substrate-binding protein